MVRGLAPRTCEGGTPVRTLGWGEYEFPAAERKAELSFCFCRPYSAFFVKDIRVTGSPRPTGTPLINAGGKDVYRILTRTNQRNAVCQSPFILICREAAPYLIAYI